MVRNIEAQFDGHIYIVHPERKFIRQGIIHKLGSKNGHLTQYTMFLFNDILIYASKKSKDKYKHHRTLHLSLCTIVDDNPGKKGIFFKVNTILTH